MYASLLIKTLSIYIRQLTLPIIILCYCFEVTLVDEYEKIDPAKLIDRCNDKKFDEKTVEKIPKKYQVCYDFFKLSWTTCK